MSKFTGIITLKDGITLAFPVNQTENNRGMNLAGNQTNIVYEVTDTLEVKPTDIVLTPGVDWEYTA